MTIAQDDVRDPTESSRDDKWPTYKKNSVEELTLNPGQVGWRIGFGPRRTAFEDEGNDLGFGFVCLVV